MERHQDSKNIAGLSPRHCRILAAGVRGAEDEGAPAEDAPAETESERVSALLAQAQAPEALTDDELGACSAEFVSLLASLAAQRPTVDIVGAMGQARAAIDSLAAVAAERMAEAADLQAQADALMEGIDLNAEGDDEETPAEEPAEDAPAETPAEDAPADPEAPATEAAARTRPRTPTPLEAVASSLPPRPATARPAEVAPVLGGSSRMVAIDLPTVKSGAEFASFAEARKAVIRAHDTIAGAPGLRDGGNQMLLSLRVEYPEGRRLSADMSAVENTAMVASAMRRADQPGVAWEDKAPLGTSLAALTASGGVCAPVNVFYGQQHEGDNGRPVRASLPGFSADRGGLRFVPPIALSAVLSNQAAAAITTITNAQDAVSTQKTRQAIACAGITEVDVTAQAARLAFGNVISRTFPERVDNMLEVTLDQIARVAERRLLTRMGQTASWSAQTPRIFDGFRDWAHAVTRAAAAIRNRNRMNPEAQIDVWAPAWLIDAFVADLRQSYSNPADAIALTRTDIESSFGESNVVIHWVRDGETASGGLTASQDFGAQSGLGAGLLDFPHQVVWYIAPAGSWLYLDGGELNIGLVRDSTLNNTNDYEVMYEFFEDVAMVGVESGRVVSNVCFNGVGPLAVAGPTCGTNGFGS